MTNKLTTAQAHKIEADKLKATICRLLKRTELEYCEYQYQTGLSYLQWYLPTDEYARYQLERSQLFWAWFKNQWAAHDFEFAKCEGIEVTGVVLRCHMYASLHCPIALAKEVKPNNTVLNEIKTKTPAYVTYTR